MNKKRVVSAIGFAIILLLSMSFILAANSTTTTSATTSTAGFDKGYTCLKDLINSKPLSELNLETTAFSILAMGYDSTLQSKLKGQIDSLKDTAFDCWPKGSCNLRDTSLVFLAYNHIGANTDKIKNWLLNQTAPTTDLIWYLQIDTNEQSSCKITYEGSTKTVVVGADKKISGSAGPCFITASSGYYWLEVRNTCYDKEFKISCDKTFLTSTLYRGKSNVNPIIYVSALTQTREQEESTTEKIQSICFKQAGTCNYEGSLWASFALANDVSLRDKVLPYLTTMASLNDRVFPSTFLYYLTGYDEYFNDINNKQNIKGFWQITDSSKKYFDTALALLSIYGRSASEQTQKAMEYLLDPSVQGEDGCWHGGNVRDTAFILYSAAQKSARYSGTGDVLRCTDTSSYSCTTAPKCTEDLNGTLLGSNYYCAAGLTCCNKKEAGLTCSQKDGIKCSFGQECSGGDMSSASDTSLCCLGGACKNEIVAYGCDGASYTCRENSCNDNEQEDTTSTCADGGVCCEIKQDTTSGPNYFLIILLIILIILLIVAIIKRNELKIWIFKMKSKFSKSPSNSNQSRPPYSPTGMRPPMRPMGMPPRPMMPPGMSPRPMAPGLRPNQIPPPGRPYPKDKELAETLERLKRMGK